MTESIRTAPTTRATAIRIACSVAGIAGAVIPRELSALSDQDDTSLLSLLRIAEQVADRADEDSDGWIAEPGLRTFHADPNSPERLAWETSVITELAPVDADSDQYRVTVYGEHVPSYTDVSRWDALRAASEVEGVEVEMLDLEAPERGSSFDGHFRTTRARELAIFRETEYGHRRRA